MGYDRRDIPCWTKIYTTTACSGSACRGVQVLPDLDLSPTQECHHHASSPSLPTILHDSFRHRHPNRWPTNSPFVSVFVQGSETHPRVSKIFQFTFGNLPTSCYFDYWNTFNTLGTKTAINMSQNASTSPSGLIAMSCVLPILSIVAVGLRFWLRGRQKSQLKLDNWLMLPALVSAHSSRF